MSEEAQNKDLPDYAAAPLRNFLDYLELSARLLQASINGIRVLTKLPRVVEVLSKPEAELARARETAEFAEREIKSGFPLLHSHSLVGSWGGLEAAIEDMLVAILMNEPKHLQSESFSKIRISVAEFESLEKEDRMRLLLEEMRRGNSSRFQGADAFEFLLDKFLLSGPINAEVKKGLWEMHNIRNVIVHRNSIADRRFVKNCPLLGYKVGDKVIVKPEQIDRFYNTLADYVLALAHRLGRCYGVDIDAKIEKWKTAKAQGGSQVPIS